MKSHTFLSATGIIFFVLLLPGIIIWLLFFNNISFPISFSQDNDANTIKIDVDTSQINNRTVQQLIRRLFQAPFDLTGYKFCLENKSYIEEGGDRRNLPVQIEWFREGLAEKFMITDIDASSIACEVLQLSGDISYNIRHRVSSRDLRNFPASFYWQHDVQPVANKKKRGNF